ncbi:ferritin-like domain-containing protein [Fodinibius sediminis]|uniref:Ferritin-like domain-containing protein n=1 Tax=Fodinibius sediminis TaxID=1214077 RepID=A0A521DW76_9BACT|nr:ferritin-like domain-containing protein [Fodinibius sediminis]SMO75999.1 Ferritin-like domain-containing protein [Fodinibius sediminis]
MADNKQKPERSNPLTGNTNTISRKNFFKYAGASAAGALAVGLYGCGDDNNPMGPPMSEDAVKLGSGDVGILNYAYALEQLEAAFYTEVMNTPYSGMTDEEKQVLEDLRKHEVAHRDFFKAAISRDAGEDAIIPGLTPNFEAIDFSDRTSVLETAVAFEDLGVSAYNGAGQLISADGIPYLVQAGKIVSVEARHAAAVRDLLNGGASFAGDDIVDPETGLDRFLLPADVLAAAANFIEEEIDASNLPSA